MVVSFNLWLDMQAVISSIFMSIAMWRTYHHVREHGYPTAAKLALMLVVHGAASTLLFAALTFIAATGQWHIAPSGWMIPIAVYTTVFATAALVTIKIGIVWIGERHSWLWRAFAVLSVGWAGFCAIAWLA